MNHSYDVHVPRLFDVDLLNHVLVHVLEYLLSLSLSLSIDLEKAEMRFIFVRIIFMMLLLKRYQDNKDKTVSPCKSVFKSVVLGMNSLISVEK